MERVSGTATEVLEARLFDVDIPLDGQDMSRYQQKVGKDARDKIMAIAYSYAPVGMDVPVADGPAPVELQRIIRNKAVAGLFSTFEVGVKLYAVVADLPIPFVRELLTFVIEAEHKEA